MLKSKKIISLLLVMVMVLSIGYIGVYAQDDSYAPATTAQTTLDNIEIDISLNSLAEDGITIYIIKDQNGDIKTISAQEYEENEEARGITFGTFHVGFKNWGARYGDLYWVANSPQPNITSVSGYAYVKSTSVLNPVFYAYEPFNSGPLGGVTYATDYLGYFDTYDETVVRVGWQNAVIMTIDGQAYTPDNSAIIRK